MTESKQRGFTLIEVLIMSSVLVIAGVVAASVFFTVLRSSTKSRLETKLKEKGQFAISVMERMIRNAVEIENISERCGLGSGEGVLGSEISIVSKDRQTTTFSCDEEGDEIASESANLAVLVSDVDVEGCEINCYWSGSGAPRIEISFSLAPIVPPGSPTPLPDQFSRLNFHTIVMPRNIR